ncbi:MAG: tetratricopeptide repeat protein [Desulfamplus sp.]
MEIPKEQRSEISKEFIALWGELPEQDGSLIINGNKRSFQRYKSGQSIPNEKTAITIKQLLKFPQLKKRLKEVKDFSEKELDAYLEKVRQKRALIKAKNTFVRYDGSCDHRPAWYLRVYNLFAMAEKNKSEKEKITLYESGYNSLKGIIDSKEIWDNEEMVPINIKVRTLEKIGLCCFYTGRIFEACDFIEKAIEENVKNCSDPDINLLIKSLYNNAGIIFTSTYKIDKAFDFLQRSLEVSEDFFLLPYLNGICLGSLSQKKELISFFLGGLNSAMIDGKLDGDNLKQLKNSIENDSEMSWALQQGLLDIIIQKINEAIK